MRVTPLSFPVVSVSAWQWLLLFLITPALCSASRLLSLPNIEFSALWPASGIFLGAILALGLRALWALIPGMLLWALFNMGNLLMLSIAATLGLAIGSAVAAGLILRSQRTIAARDAISPLHYLPNLYLKGALIGSGISAMLGSVGYWFTVAPATSHAWLDILLIYWLLEALGVVLFAPLFFFILRRPHLILHSLREDFSRRPVLIWSFLVVTTITLSIVLYSLGDTRYAPLFVFALFPLVCWFATDAKPASVDSIIPTFAVTYVVFSLYNWGGSPQANNMADLLRVLFQISILAVMAQIVATINHHRHSLLDRFRRQAHQDFRTGLVNDRGLNDEIQHLIEHHPSGSHWLAYISLTDMQIIKELLALDGAITVESVLTQQLRQFAFDKAIISRLSEGRFAVLLPGIDRKQAVLSINELYLRLSQPVDEAGMTSRLRLAIGITRIDNTLNQSQQYISVASKAANRARHQSVPILWIDNPQQIAREHYTLLRRFELLKQAIEHNELLLYAQEIRSIRQPEHGLAFEVLVRLRNEQGEILPPAQFIPAAEAFGLMPALDRSVIRHTLEFLAADRERLKRINKCAINLSGASLSTPELANYLAAQLKHFAIPPHLLTFEITETEAIHNAEQAADFIQAVHKLGCRIALDDFGTGLASFEYLRRFRFDELKIDGVFIRELASNNVDESIVHAICNVAATMKLKTIAEFVENADLSSHLAKLGVDYAQGYGIGKPKPIGELV